MMLEPTAPAPTCNTRPRFGGPAGSGDVSPPLGSASRQCRQVSHRSSVRASVGRRHASRNTLPTPSATAKRRTDVIGFERYAQADPRLEIATHPSAHAVTPFGHAGGTGPMVREGDEAGGSAHRMLRNGFAVRTAASTAVVTEPIRMSETAGKETVRAGAHRASRFAAAATAGRAVSDRSASG